MHNDLHARYERSVKWAYKWMDATGCTITELASRLGVSRPTLSRYLIDTETRYKPAPGRECHLRILDGIEQLCRSCNVIDWRLGHVCDTLTPEALVFQSHTIRLKDAVDRSVLNDLH